MAFQFAPAWMENSDEHHAVIYRTMLSSVTGGASGVASSTALRVAERDGTADMSVDIAAGGAFIPSTRSVHQGTYHAYNDAVINVPITASHPTNDRIDRILLHVRDSAQDVALTQDDITVHVIEGTPASVPTLPPIDVDDWIELARVLVPAGATAITNAEITDVREMISEQGSGTRLIEEVVLGSAASTVNFDVPQTFSDLYVLINARSTATGSSFQFLECAINGDNSSGSYFGTRSGAVGGTPSAANYANQNWARVGYVTTSAAATGSFGTTRVDIPGYRLAGVNKHLLGRSSAIPAGTLADWIDASFGMRRTNSAAITSLQFRAASGNFASGSRLALYGIR